MSLSQFFSIMRARWWVALAVLLLTVVSAVGISLLLPKQYIATATVVVDQMRPDPVAAAVYNNNPSPSFMATQVDVIKSESVAKAVVRKFQMAEGDEVKDRWMSATSGEGTVESWVAQRVILATEVKPSRESNVISVAYKADDSAYAAKMANAIVEAYLNLSLTMKVGPAQGYKAFFERQAQEARANLERAQAKLSAYQREKGVVVATDGQIDVESARLNELSTQLATIQIA